jgi:hypothetical protein
MCDCIRTGQIGNCELCGAPIDDVSDIGDRIPDDPGLMWCMALKRVQLSGGNASLPHAGLN